MMETSRNLKLLSRLALAPSLCLMLGASAESILESQPPELEARLREDRVVVLEDVSSAGPTSFIVAMVLFTQPMDVVADLLKEAERQPEYRKELVGVATVEQLPDGRIDEQRIKILFTELVYRLRYFENPETGRLTWSLVEDFDNDIAKMEGFWELYDFEGAPGYTLGRFGSNVDVGRGVPRFVQKGMSRKTVVGYVENLQKWIDSGGEWRP